MITGHDLQAKNKIPWERGANFQYDHVKRSVDPIVPKSIVVSKTFKFHLGDKFKVTIQSGEPFMLKEGV